MVTITRVYTRKGDKGSTSLGDGTRVPKHSARTSAYATIDEANAAIGLARLHAVGTPLDDELARIQNDLFDVGADICFPENPDYKREPLRVTAAQVDYLEATIDRLRENQGRLDSFILPGGTPLAAHLHFARTVVRRAERGLTALMAEEPVNPEALRYLNRLSDLMFVAARHANNDGADDVLWIAGKNREEKSD